MNQEIMLATDAVKAALLVASAKENKGRHYIQGIYIDASGHIVATNGYVLFCAESSAFGESVFIPVAQTKAALDLNKGDHISVTKNTIGEVPFHSEDNFPAWKRVIPTIQENAQGSPNFSRLVVDLVSKVHKTMGQVLMRRLDGGADNPAIFLASDWYMVAMPMPEQSSKQEIEDMLSVVAKSRVTV